MSRHRELRFLVFTLCLIASSAFAFSSEAVGQQVEPGANPPWSRGSPDAPVTIEVFNDYQCPACASFNRELKKIEAEYKGSVRVVFRNHPLTHIHKNAQAAARAAEAAGIQGKFFEMVDRIYDGWAQWHESDEAVRFFASYARELGLDVDRFASDMDGVEVRRRILLDAKRALSLDVNATPTILVNGKNAGFPAENVRRAIKEALGVTKAITDAAISQRHAAARE